MRPLYPPILETPRLKKVAARVGLCGTHSMCVRILRYRVCVFLSLQEVTHLIDLHPYYVYRNL
jgi:hypothetical protein